MNSHFIFRGGENSLGNPYPEHSHQDYEVYYLTKGQCQHFTEDKVYPMTAGDIVIFPPGFMHRCIYNTPFYIRLLFYCSVDYIPPSARPFFDRVILYSPTADSARQISSIYTALHEAVNNRDPFSEDTIRCCVTMLFLLITKNISRSDSPSFPTPFVEQTVVYIHENYMNRITLTDAATHCMISPEHLSRVFKKETGMGFNEYLNLHRLQKAATLLESGQVKRVSDVALLCGFSESNYFSHVYKKMFGISPSQVSKSLKKDPAAP